MENEFPLNLELRIDWSELDLFGHVNNVMYFKYIQASRVNYWDAIGLGMLHLETNKGPILASASCRFLKPLFYPGNIKILARMQFIKTSSFGLQHRILNENGEICAGAEDVMVMYDFNTGQKIEFPADLRAIVEKLEGHKY